MRSRRGVVPAACGARFLGCLLYLLARRATAQPSLEPCRAMRTEAARRQVAEMRAATTDFYEADTRFLGTNHKAWLRMQGRMAIATVGMAPQSGNPADYVHAMLATRDVLTVHFIDFVWVEDQDGNIIAGKAMSATDPYPATLVFYIPNTTTVMTAYAHCNKHGSYRGQSMTVLPAQWTPAVGPTCEVATCRDTAGSPATCTSWVTEWQRLYTKTFSRVAAVDGGTSLSHKPVLTIFGNGSAGVVVGAEYLDANGAPLYHPQQNGTTDTIHFILGVWVQDQDGNLVATRQFFATDPGPAQMTFPIPVGTRSMTAYAYCNLHGMFNGTLVVVYASQTSSTTAALCQVRQCPQVMPGFAATAECAAYRADAYRQQAASHAIAPLSYQVPFTRGNADEMHNPYIILNGKDARAVVGKGAFTGIATDPVHPMVDDSTNFGANLHFIQRIWVEDQRGNIIAHRSLSPSEKAPATLYFDVPGPPGFSTITSIRAYAVCNLHGLFAGPNVTVNATNYRTAARNVCSMQQCIEGTAVSACQGYTAEFQRRAGSATAQTDPYGMHLPYLIVAGTQGTIVVGAGAVPGNTTGPIHPMNFSSDQSLVHFVSHIFVKDEHGNLVALCELLPMDPAPPSCRFQIPSGIVSLRPFAFCPRHGLFVGDTFPIAPANQNATAARTCVARQCNEAQPMLGSAPLVSASVEAAWNAQKDTSARLSTVQMCEVAVAAFVVPSSKVDDGFRIFLDQLLTNGDAASETERRLRAYDVLIPAMQARGGRWYAHPFVVDNLGLNDSSLRTDLIDDEEMRFTATTVGKGGLTYVDGVDTPVVNNDEEVTVIWGTFAMDWGYKYYKALGPHYSIFYTPNFTTQTIEVMLCAKTLGWMGMGWITSDHAGHVMNHTDMAVLFVKDGKAYAQDRFAFTTEEPVKDSALSVQRQGPDGQWLIGGNDLTLIGGAFGAPGAEWCADKACNPGFTMVQYSRPFRTPDAWDAKLPTDGPSVKIIFSFSTVDPTEAEMVQHLMTSTGFADLTWNRQCPPGTYFHQDRVQCISCDVGTFRPESAPTDKCIQCPSGAFQERTGQASCVSCKPNFVTAGPGATQERACRCSGPSLENVDGWYHVPTCGDEPAMNPDGTPAECSYLGECRDCPIGMLCPGGFDLTPTATTSAAALDKVDKFCGRLAGGNLSSCTSRDYCEQNLGDEFCGHATPALKRGYATLPGDPLTVYICKEPAACPGGSPGTCGVLRDPSSVACALCQPSTFKDGGVCKRCQGSSVVPFVLLLITAAICLTAFACMVNPQVVMRAGSATTAGIMVGTMFSAVQTLTTFSSLEIEWVEPLKSILKVASLISFDLEVVRMGCIFDSKPDETYALRLLVLPCCGCFLSMVLVVKKVRRPAMKMRVDLCNTLGAIYSLFFIPIVLLFLSPFICYRHPSGFSSMISAPAVLCYHHARHKTMVALGVLAFFFLCVPFCALIFWGIWHYERDVRRHNTDSLNMFRFLFIRFTPEAYYYGGVVMLRSLCICFVPILTGKDPALQVVLLVVVLLLFKAFQLWLKPWRPDPSKLLVLDANVIDATLTSGCIMLLICGALCTDFRANQASIQHVVIAVFAGLLVVVLVALLAALRERFVPRPWYKWFLTHHKGGAAAQARLMKALLCARGRWEVFIDSDNLTDLDKLFDTVRVRTGMLVVYATSQVLRRPWCAGEIVVAAKTGLKMVLVETASFMHPTAEEMNNLGEYLDASRTLLTAYGIDLEAVRWSYEYLFSAAVPRVEVCGAHGRRKFEGLADIIVGNSFDIARIGKNEPTNLERHCLELLRGTVVLTADAADDEATAAAAILALKVQGELIARRNSTDEAQVLMVTADYANLTDNKFGQEGSETLVDYLCAVVANARAILVILSKGTLRSVTQLVVVVEAMMGLDPSPLESHSAGSFNFGNKRSHSAGSFSLANKRSTSRGNTADAPPHFSTSRPASGCTDNSGQASTPRSAPSSRGQVLVPIQMQGFEFPEERYYSDVLPRLWYGSGGEEEQKAIRTFFKRISLPFSANASDTIITAQAADILARIPIRVRPTGPRVAAPKLPERWQLYV